MCEKGSKTFNKEVGYVEIVVHFWELFTMQCLDNTYYTMKYKNANKELAPMSAKSTFCNLQTTKKKRIKNVN